MTQTVIAYDLGTGGNKASWYDAEGNCLAAEFVPYETSFPQVGWHEQRPDDWWDAVVRSTQQLLATEKADPQSIAALAISGHSLGCVPLDARGRLLRASTPIWSDKRPGRQAEKFFERIDPIDWYRRTGNGFPAAHYTVFKMMWYRDHEPEMFDQIDRVIGTKDYVNYRLTGRIATDFSYASGTGVYDLTGWRYSDELIGASELSPSLFAEIVPSTQILGELTEEAANRLGLPRTVQVACGGVDNSCMALGARAFLDGRVYTSLGSSAWIAVSSRKPLLDDEARPFVFTHVVPEMFTSAVAIFSSGTSLKWVGDHLCSNLTDVARDEGRNPYEAMIHEAEQSPPGANRLMFLPSMAGGSSLDASPNIRGALIGLDLGHTQSDVIRATLEGIALNLRLVLDRLRSLESIEPEILAVGGSAKSRFWRQLFADAFDCRILKSNVDQEAGSLGAAAIAAVGVGLWDDFSPIDSVHRIEHTATADPDRSAFYARLLPTFQKALHCHARLGDMMAELG